MNANEIIEASAGTGKTEALAQRIIAVLALVKPSEVVALTFSRMAAGEIFERLVMLLAKAGNADLLRSVIAAQHLSQIGTLDSFLMRIVRNFPLELGLRGDLRLMDDFEARSERARVSFSILRRTDRATARAFVEAFAQALHNEDVRSFIESYRAFIANWHQLVLEYPQAPMWGFAAEGSLSSAADDIAALERAADDLQGMLDHPKWPEFVETVRNFRGSFAFKGFAKKFNELPDLLTRSGTVEIEFLRKPYPFLPDKAEKLRNAFRAMCAFVVNRQRRLAQGVYKVISAFEKEYARQVRMAGRLVFDDVPRLITALPEATRLSLEYRLDLHIRAWALDEFQDTSRTQWRALENLVDEAKQSGGETSLFIVGDRKQAIYGWREGDVGIFERELADPCYHKRVLAKSYRFGRAITEAVNRVFAQGLIFEHFPDWQSPVHQTAHDDYDGFVQAVESPGKSMTDFVTPIFNALTAFDPVARGLSAAILVRSNSFGKLLASELKLRGLRDVVWEGDSDILDTPALLPFLDLVQLADHPSDLVTARHFGSTPLAAAKYPDGVPNPAEISRDAAALFVTKGLVRAFRDLRALLPESPTAAWDEFTEGRFTDMLRAASEFEQTMKPGTRLSDFAAFLTAQKKRNVAEPGKIRILTIHRAKGLGFDYVILPLYEHAALNKPANGALLGENWLLPAVDAKACRAFPQLEQAARLRQLKAEQEALSIYYVAMTRAKKALTIVLHPPAKTATASVRFSDLVRAALPDEIGNREWARNRKTGQTYFTNRKTGQTYFTIPHRQPRTTFKRRLPSLNFVSGESAAQFFRVDGRQQAMAHGTAVHAQLANVEFNDLLPRPADCSGLWREKPFEIFDGKNWISGRFDRVVFTGEGASRSAEIIDFKTGRTHDEAKYASQLNAYKAALTALTGIPPSRISTRILWV